MAGIAFNAVAFAAISVGDTIGKLVLLVMPLMQMIALRSMIVLLLLSVIFFRAVQRGTPPWRTKRLGLHLLRVVAQFSSMISFLAALREMPLTVVVTINFMAPVFVAMLARVLLGEKMSWTQLGSIILGFAGCMVILQPGSIDFSVYALLSLFSALAWALSIVWLRELTRTEEMPVILFFQNATICLAASLALPFVWAPADPMTLALLLATSVLQIAGQWFSTRALSIARAATVAPIQYTQLLWVTLLGWLIFQEWPGVHVWIGAGLIVASGLWLMRAQGNPPPAA